MGNWIELNFENKYFSDVSVYLSFRFFRFYNLLFKVSFNTFKK